MGLEITPSTQVWISHGDDWEQVPGVTGVRLEEDLPVEEASTDLGISFKTLTSWVPSCPSGRHPQHPAMSCEEHEELAAAFQDFCERLFAAAFDAARQAARRYQEALAQSLVGIDTWEPRGLAEWLTERHEPTPIERAMEILAPYLAREPLYQPRQRWLKATATRLPADEEPGETGSAALGTGRPAWQSPYGPAPRRR